MSREQDDGGLFARATQERTQQKELAMAEQNTRDDIVAALE